MGERGEGEGANGRRGGKGGGSEARRRPGKGNTGENDGYVTKGEQMTPVHVRYTYHFYGEWGKKGMNAGDWSGMGVGARAMGTAVASRHEDHSLATQRDPLTIQWAIYIKEIYRRRICG